MFDETRVEEREKLVKNIHLKPDTTNKILLIDADTIAYATCSGCEYGDDETGYEINMEEAFEVANAKINNYVEITGCKDFELHFTSGKNFRYHLTPDYKSNRKDTRYPTGLRELKTLLVEHTPTKAFIHRDYEADDIVCMLKREYPEKYILCSVDKDVFNGVSGIHFNYYENFKYKILMSWKETTQAEAIRWPYLQCLMGDSADGITGVKGIGPKKAEAILGSTTDEIVLWRNTLKAYLDNKQTEKEAILNMRLVHMHQVTKEYKLELWTAKSGDDV
jgi:DNA polymerase-1